MNGQLGETTFVAFDTETTGIGPGCRLVEIAGARFKGEQLLDRFETLIDPEVPMTEEAIAVNQITDDMVKGHPKAGESLKRFFDFAEGAVMVAHNASFDAAVIGLELTRNRLPAPTNPILDTLTMARRCYPGSSHSLDALIDLLGIPVPPERHRAFADADVVRHLVRKLIEAVGGDATPLSRLVESSTRAETLAEYVLAFPPLPSPLKLIEVACGEGTKVNLHLDAGASRAKQQIVNPRLCYEWKNVVYLEAWVPDERVVRAFRLDKIVKVERGASSGLLF